MKALKIIIIYLLGFISLVLVLCEVTEWALFLLLKFVGLVGMWFSIKELTKLIEVTDD